jgi:atypical dual specificity phosphatase
MESTQPIAENLWWVIPGKLAGVRKPMPEEIAELQAAGVGAIDFTVDGSDDHPRASV